MNEMYGELFTLLDPSFLYVVTPGGGGADSASLNFTPLNPSNRSETWLKASYTQKQLN